MCRPAGNFKLTKFNEICRITDINDMKRVLLKICHCIHPVPFKLCSVKLLTCHECKFIYLFDVFGVADVKTFYHAVSSAPLVGSADCEENIPFFIHFPAVTHETVSFKFTFFDDLSIRIAYIKKRYRILLVVVIIPVIVIGFCDIYRFLRNINGVSRSFKRNLINFFYVSRIGNIY